MYQLIAAGVIAIGLFAGGTFTGIKLEKDHRDALELAQEKAAEAKVKAEQDKAQLAATQLEQTREQLNARQQTITRTLTKVVTRKIYARTCFDAAGVQLANSALQGPSPDLAKSNGGVPGPRPAAGRNGIVSPPKTD